MKKSIQSLVEKLENITNKKVVLKERSAKNLVPTVEKILMDLGYGEPLHIENENGRTIVWATVGEGTNHKQELKAMEKLKAALSNLPVEVTMHVKAESQEAALRGEAFYPVSITI